MKELFEVLSIHHFFSSSLCWIRNAESSHAFNFFISEGMKFYISDNKVILTEGFDGIVPVKYFERIESWPDRKPISFWTWNSHCAVIPFFLFLTLVLPFYFGQNHCFALMRHTSFLSVFVFGNTCCISLF